MMTETSEKLQEILKSDLDVSPTYEHGPKQVIPGEALELDGVILKWYALQRSSAPMPEEISTLARSFLQRTPLEAKGLGFVILHRCGNDFYFLLLSTWRGNNEAWETVFYKDGAAMEDFALFPREKMHKPTFCVWEMVPLMHEQRAWEEFLHSKRDSVAAEKWLADVYSGPA